MSEKGPKFDHKTQTDITVCNQISSPIVGPLRPMSDACRSVISFDSSKSVRNDVVSVTSGSFILGPKTSDWETTESSLSTKSDSNWTNTAVSERSFGKTERRFGVRQGPLSLEIAGHARDMRKARACWSCRMAKFKVSYSAPDFRHEKLTRILVFFWRSLCSVFQII
jgi:hypothetical protein